MALSKDLRSFAVVNGSTTAIVVTGLGFTPKLLCFRWGRNNPNGLNTAQNQTVGLGWVGPSNNQWCVVSGGQDNRATDQRSGCVLHESSAVVHIAQGSAALGGRITWALDADGYTGTITSAIADEYTIDVVAWGGSSIDAVVGTRALPTSAGTFATTVTGITPNFLIAAVAGSRYTTASAYGNTGGAWYCEGMAKSSSNRQCALIGAGNGATTTEAWGRISTGALAYLYNNTTLEATLDFTSFAADTFTLDKQGSDVTHASRMGYVAIRVDQSWLGTLLAQTSTGNFSSTAPGFQGNTLILSGRGDVTASEGSLSTAANASSLIRGMAVSASSRTAIWTHNEGGIVLGNSDCYNARETTHCFRQYDRTAQNTGSLIQEIDFVSWDATGLTLNQTDAAPVQTLMLGAVFGETPGAGSPIAVKSFGYHQRGMR